MGFYPPIHERSTEELLKMAADPASWQPDALALARMELDRRGIPEADVKEREIAFSTASIALETLRERHAQESYTTGKMAVIFLSAPLLLIGKIISLKLPLNFKLGLSELNRRNYRKKYRQRMWLLIAGAVFWFLILAAIPD